jgi:uroporphyrin-III C-methyltransferase
MGDLTINGKISLVGGGPGDPELITLKGIRAIQKADIILYDALIHPDILNYAKIDARKIFVGKRYDNHQFDQEEINEMLVFYARAGKYVVRLKGGDPFVFGRGSEELDFLQNNHISAEVISGVSSAIAVPSNQGIPLTKRNISSSFWVITGSTKQKNVSADIVFASQSSATIVVLMGLRNLITLTKTVQTYRSSSTPIAVIQNGTLQNERAYISTLENIKHEIKDIDLNAPTIIVIGNVVAEHPSFFEEEIQRVIHDLF